MISLKSILLGILILVAVAPTLAYLCMKWGLVGFYRGKEVSTGQSEFNSVRDKNKETE